MKSNLLKISRTAQNAICSLTLCLLLTACVSSPQEIVVTRTEAITLIKEIMVPVPASMTAQVPIPILPRNADTLELGATYKATVIRLMIANMQLDEIGKLE